MYPDLIQSVWSEVYAITTFTCENAGDQQEHDVHIYNNFCTKCHRTIDSRECKVEESEFPEGINGEMLLCMRCGGTRKIQPGTYCPNANCKRKLDPDDYDNIRMIVKCKVCNHDGSYYGIRPYKLARVVKEATVVVGEESPLTNTQNRSNIYCSMPVDELPF